MPRHCCTFSGVHAHLNGLLAAGANVLPGYALRHTSFDGVLLHFQPHGQLLALQEHVQLLNGSSANEGQEAASWGQGLAFYAGPSNMPFRRAPSVRRARARALATPNLAEGVATALRRPRRAGVCGVTTFHMHDCERGESGAWELVGKLRTLRTCAELCLGCARCRYVSFSQARGDCSWYRSCSELQRPRAMQRPRDRDAAIAAATFTTVQVRADADG